MHILIIPSENYMTKQSPTGGIFQYHQALALKTSGYKVGVLGVGFRSSRQFVFGRTSKVHCEYIDEICVIRFYMNKLLPKALINQHSYFTSILIMAKDAFRVYITKFGRPDVLHAHNALYGGLIAQEISREYDIPYVVTEHSSKCLIGMTTWEKSVSKQCYGESNAVIAVSSYLKNAMLSFSSGIGKPIQVVPNIIDPLFMEVQLHEGLNEPKAILSIGSLDANKNHKMLIEAFSKKYQQRKDVSLTIVGSGPKLGELKMLARKLGVSHLVRFTGMLDRVALIDEFGKCSFLVLSSLAETFGVVLIEALSFGVPVLSTNSGGPVDIVTDYNGLVVNADVEELADGMERMFETQFDRIKISQMARGIYGPKQIANKLTEIYDQIMVCSR